MMLYQKLPTGRLNRWIVEPGTSIEEVWKECKHMPGRKLLLVWSK